MTTPGDAAATLSTSRRLAASPQRVFAAFADARRLARWWGPEDFTNTFERFDLVPEG